MSTTSLGTAMELALIRRDIRNLIARLERILGPDAAFRISAKLLEAYEAMGGE